MKPKYSIISILGSLRDPSLYVATTATTEEEARNFINKYNEKYEDPPLIVIDLETGLEAKIS